MIALVIVLVVLVALVLFGISAFNRLRTLDVKAQEALGGIDVQLTRRADLVPNLVETVRGYAAHEKGVLEEVTAARASVAKAAASGTVEEKAAAAGALDASLVNVMAVAENYPDLKASTNFLDLQRQLADTENQLAFARQYYNDAVSSLNTAVVTIPTNLLAGVAGVSTRAFYAAPLGQTAPPQVSF
jgi:LemA protein